MSKSYEMLKLNVHAVWTFFVVQVHGLYIIFARLSDVYIVRYCVLFTLGTLLAHALMTHACNHISI